MEYYSAMKMDEHNNSMYESHRPSVGQKKSDTREYTEYNSIEMKFKNKINGDKNQSRAPWSRSQER